MRIFSFILNTFCIWLLLKLPAEGSDIECTVDCACCTDRKCAQGKYFPDECTLGCIDGYFGARCYTKCTHNCKKCDYDADVCTACYDGYYPGPSRDCTSKCLPNCKTCTSHISCTSCKEEYYNENGSNDCRYRKCPGNCKCDLNEQCMSCMDGYYDISNSCESLCPENCVTCSSSANCDSCTNGHYNGNQNDDSNLPLLNVCTYKCRDNCVQCSSYDVCSKCQSGLYGPICEKSCSDGCSNDICDIHTGNCDCSPNFVGGQCDRCQNGKYGDMCDQLCSSVCKGNVCERNSGSCIDGCVNNKNCINCLPDTSCKQCKSGYFNDQCDEPCPINCLDICSIKKGICDDCKRDFYGERCNFSCSSACKIGKETSGSQCQQTDGKCLYGCYDGFYGINCSQKCSNFCNDNICEQEDGTCTNGCQKKVRDDCLLVAASKSSEQPHYSATIILGIMLAVSVVGNVILVVTVILLQFRKRVNTGEKTERPHYENADMELKFRYVANVKDKTSAAQASINENMTSAQDYQDLDRVQVSEHEYGRIETPAGLH